MMAYVGNNEQLKAMFMLFIMKYIFTFNIREKLTKFVSNVLLDTQFCLIHIPRIFMTLRFLIVIMNTNVTFLYVSVYVSKLILEFVENPG